MKVLDYLKVANNYAWELYVDVIDKIGKERVPCVSIVLSILLTSFAGLIASVITVGLFTAWVAINE